MVPAWDGVPNCYLRNLTTLPKMATITVSFFIINFQHRVAKLDSVIM